MLVSHVLTLLTMPFVTAWVCRHLWEGRPTVRQAMWAIAVAPVSVFLAGIPRVFLVGERILGVLHPWYDPFVQWALPAACLTAVLLCAHQRAPRVYASVMFGVLAFMLCWQHAMLLNSGRYIPDPALVEEAAAWRAEALAKVRDRLRQAGERDTTSYETGWTRDTVGRSPAFDFGGVDPLLCRVELSPLWHSGFTRLYPVRYVSMRLWYPGGSPADAWNRVDWRDRTD